MKNNLDVPVIALDGPGQVGKSTTRALVARELGFHQLDSGMYYRLVGLLVFRRRLDDQQERWKDAAEELGFILTIERGKIFLGQDEVTSYIRDPQIGQFGSRVAVDSGVRQNLLPLQLAMRQAPGLVADGRDMGIIFPDTPYRYFLTASPRVQAERQVLKTGVSREDFNFEELVDVALLDILERDHRDSGREVNPLVQHPAAYRICTDHISAQEVARTIITDFHSRM